jgi:hypothetical protein
MHLYNVSQTEVAQYNVVAYQEDECYNKECLWQAVSDITYDKPLNRDNELGPVFEAAKIARLMKESRKELNVIDDEDEEDDTLMEVDSDDE